MTDLITAEEAKKLLDGTTPGPWRAEGDPWSRIVWSSAENRVCFMAHSNGLDDARDVATSNLVAAAPDLARTVIALHAQLADAKAAQAMVVERAVGVAKRHRSKVQINEPLWHDGQDWASDRIAEAIEALADTDGMALVQALRAERDEAKRLMEMRHREMLAADELMRKHQRRADKAEADRDRLAAANAVLEARVAELEGALRDLGGPVCMYDGRNIVITAVSHGDAIRLVADARAALATQEAGT